MIIKLLLVIVLDILLVSSFTLNPKDLVVSITIDPNNIEILREGIRLLHSIKLNGGTLNQASIEVALPLEEDMKLNSEILKKIRSFNISSIRYCKRYSAPNYSPTLNKFCSFSSSLLLTHKYFLYLDADIFVSNDPLPLFEQQLQSNQNVVACGRPWNSFIELNNFYDFLMMLDPNDKYESLLFDSPLLEAYSFGGWTYYGLCNTGVYFMPTDIASTIATTSLMFLEKLEALNQRASFEDQIVSNIFNITFVNIDSLLIWASQYYHEFTISILPPSMNYLAPIEDQITRFIDLERNSEEVNNGSYIHLIHFSRGSDLRFTLSLDDHSTNQKCYFEITGILTDESENNSHLLKQIQTNMKGDSCSSFYFELKDFEINNPK